MINEKPKKIKRLKRGHIWPSLIFLILSIVLADVVATASTALIVAYFTKERMELVYNDVMNANRMISSASSPEGLQNVLDYIERDTDFSDAIFLLDEDGNVICGFGEATYDLERYGEMSTPQKCILYADRNAMYNRFTEDRDMDPETLVEASVAAAVSSGHIHLESLNANRIVENFKSGKKDILFEEPIWLGTQPIEQTTVLMRCKIYFYLQDLLLALVIGGLFTVVMLLPILFLFINLVTNVFNQRRMTKLLYTDRVTNGRSWLYFEHHAYKVLRARGNAGKTYALVDFSLMKYRGYCNCHGVQAGEELLAKINRCMDRYMKRSECVARYGKSSFALIMRCEGRESCVSRLNGIIREVQEQIGHGGLVYHAGIYFAEPVIPVGEKQIPRRKCVDVAEFYNCAGAARASLTDENMTAVAVFDQKLLEEQLWEHKVEEKMYYALENEEFQVYIQPKYNPVTEQLAGAEALVRWINQEDGFISPGRFIPIFEKNGFITRLDDYMISHVAKLQADWIAAGKEVVPISVNVSRAHFANPDLAKHICELVDVYRLPHHLLEIELTESAFFDDKAALLRTVRQLKELGFDISMDDFGAGYSSLNSLKDLPLDVLKLDAEFFRGEDGEERGEIVVSQAIDLAKKLNMKIVAEGVEKKNQVEFLAAHDCDMIQGYYFAKPMPADEYAAKMSDVCGSATRQEPAMIKEKTEQDNGETASLPEANV